MLRYEIFSCTCTHVSCYAMRSSLALAPTFHVTLWDLLLHLHPRFMLRYEIALVPTFHATLWDLLLHLHATLWDLLLHLHSEQEIQRIDLWPSTCSTLSKVSCSDTTVGANSGVSLASWRKKTFDFFGRRSSKYMEKHSRNRKKGVPSRASHANSNRNLDTRNKRTG